MNALQQWMEKYLVPVAAKIGSQKHLVALRDSFVGMLPATMVGAMATLVSVLIGTVPSAVQQLVEGARPHRQQFGIRRSSSRPVRRPTLILLRKIPGLPYSS